MHDGDDLTIALPESVRATLARLDDAGHDAALVGGSVRDLVSGAPPQDWDVATAAPPERVAELFPGSGWTNRFGTVTVRVGDGPEVQVTTFRFEGPYLDHRRPVSVAWGRSLEEDLSRRDFTVNAIAWCPTDLSRGAGLLVDPHGGIDDLRHGVLRAVGDPEARFAEDALRMVRAARFAARLGLEIDPATADAIRRNAGAAAKLSGERVRDELLRMLDAADPARPPSVALELLEQLGLLPVLLPELAALRGVPQAKALAGDALDHSLRTADALPAGRPLLRLAGLLHDLGKATTLADGHFFGHEVEGAQLAQAVAERLRLSRAESNWIVRLVRQHMFAYTPDWTDAAVRRFIRRVGVDLLDDLFALRLADNAASGVADPRAAGLEALRDRIDAVIAGSPLSQGQLAVDGRDLTAVLGIAPGPLVGELLRRLLEAVLDDPALNRRELLLDLARQWAAEVGADAHRPAAGHRAGTGAGDGPAATIGGPGAVPSRLRSPAHKEEPPPS
ncbi:MAG TPA: CCA tRNA nucleotidyltransferase [Candidatus Limnocylindria bacterium]